jgi:hypothetical protein
MRASPVMRQPAASMTSMNPSGDRGTLLLGDARNLAPVRPGDAAALFPIPRHLRRQAELVRQFQVAAESVDEGGVRFVSGLLMLALGVAFSPAPAIPAFHRAVTELPHRSAPTRFRRVGVITLFRADASIEIPWLLWEALQVSAKGRGLEADRRRRHRRAQKAYGLLRRPIRGERRCPATC